MCHGLWLGGESLDTGKGLYPRTENMSISTPNTVCMMMMMGCENEVRYSEKLSVHFANLSGDCWNLDRGVPVVHLLGTCLAFDSNPFYCKCLRWKSWVILYCEYNLTM
ncbi:Uncharacterized protein TCM_007995 [Theobroma cacao]|uniref:Uncharacterized protein n=1 Tax=Theobroma cacao TaxID=3641 RepID=A0A061E324_THECC|nr:Uncharacterized protein TCM_007995 [Theobroma cacao]